RVRLFPGQFDDLFELQGGEQKTHTVWMHFGQGAAAGRSALDWVHRPAVLHAAPKWYCECGAFPYTKPATDETREQLESFLQEVIEGGKSFFAKREVIDE